MRELITTLEAAEELGVSPARVRHLVLEGRLPAGKFGRDLMIKLEDLDLVRDSIGKVGRPKKGSANSKTQKRARKSTKK